VPQLHLIVGPNGAGKSTFYSVFLKPKISAPFINADIIQKDELEDDSLNASYMAAKLADKRRKQYLIEGKSFIAETVFSHPSKLDIISDAVNFGFSVFIYHVGLVSPELSVARVSCRVDEGGHDVPEQKIRQRFVRNQDLITQSVDAA
jgi:predicted ABC-type ATPase